MDRAKEQIKKNFNHKEIRYKRVWEIIDEHWNLQLHRPLHAAAYYLNPKFQYDPSINADEEVNIGLYTTIERMYPDVQTRVRIDAQLEKFKRAEALWWDSYGEGCKELQRLAIRVLSLTCSATGCERNWSTFDHVHSKKRNHMEQQRLNALVFVKYNLNLEARHEKRQAKGELYDPVSLSDMESDDEWITESELPCLQNDCSWMDVQECFNEDEGPSDMKRRRGPRNLNAVKKRKVKGNGNGKEKLDDVIELEDEEEETEEEEEEEYEKLDEDDLADGDEDDDNIDLDDFYDYNLAC